MKPNRFSVSISFMVVLLWQAVALHPSYADENERKLIAPEDLPADLAPPPPPTEAEAKAIEKAAGNIECSMKEIRECKGIRGCPGHFTSRGHTRKECRSKVTKLCSELCENSKGTMPENANGVCKCGPVQFRKKSDAPL